MSFYKWIIKNYSGMRCPAGDLADDAKSDENFPRKAKSYRTILDYLESNGACDACLDIFEKAFKLYKRDESYVA